MSTCFVTKTTLAVLYQAGNISLSVVYLVCISAVQWVCVTPLLIKVSCTVDSIVIRHGCRISWQNKLYFSSCSLLRRQRCGCSLCSDCICSWNVVRMERWQCSWRQCPGQPWPCYSSHRQLQTGSIRWVEIFLVNISFSTLYKIESILFHLSRYLLCDIHIKNFKNAHSPAA